MLSPGCAKVASASKMNDFSRIPYSKNGHQNADGGIEYEGEIGISPGMEENLHTAHNKGVRRRSRYNYMSSR